MSKTTCPKCKNEKGFVFGTCIDCGWNHLDDTFHWIKVNIDALRTCTLYTDELIDAYDRRVTK